MKAKQLLPALLCAGLLACSGHERTGNSHSDLATAATPSPAPSNPLRAQAAAPTTTPKQVDAPSVYDLSLPLLDQTGAGRPLDTFRGHPVLVTMFYGSCPVACPLLTSELKRLERKLPDDLRADVRVLMVSFDAARDTPQALTLFEKERGLDSSRWMLASARDDDARALAGVLGIKYRKLDNGAFFHSSVIVLLDRQGRPQARLEGTNDDGSAILAALTAPAI